MSETKKVLFFSPYTGQWAWMFHVQIDAVVASALRLRGCEVLISGCDGVYKDCYILRGSGSSATDMCQSCSQTGKRYFGELFKLPYIQIRHFISALDYLIANQWIETVSPENYADAYYKNLPLGRWVTSSIYTYFRISAFSLSRPDVRKVHRQYLIDGLVTYNALSRLFKIYKPTNLFIFNARLAPYRIALEAARKHQIDVIVHERGYINNSYILFENRTCLSNKDPLDLVEAWEKIPLGQSELLRVKYYFTERESGQNMNLPSFYDYKTDYVDVRRLLRIPGDAKVFTVFTSSEDELAMDEEHAGITDQITLIDRLIEIFAKREEYLVVRHHPNIAGPTGNLSDSDFMTRAYRQALSAPKNVRIVMPSERLTSYALLWQTDAAMSFFSTIAIEAAARGVPTASIALSRYIKALRYVILNSETVYLNKLIDSLLSESARPNVEDFRKLYRFTHAYFLKFSGIFRSIDANGLRFESEKELLPGIDPVLDRICDRIMKGGSLQDLPSSEANNRSPIEEDEFFKKEIVEVREVRERIREQTLKQKVSDLNLPIGVICLKSKDDEDSNELLQAWIGQSRYEHIVVRYCINVDWSDYQNIIKSLLGILEVSQEDYILVTNRFSQYDEAFLSSAIDILLADDTQETQGVLGGGFLPFSESMNVQEIFYKQEIFTQRKPDITYERAVETLPMLEHPLTMLSFCLMRKQGLVEILQAVIKLPTARQAAEGLFNILNNSSIHKIQLPMMVIHKANWIV